MIRSFAFSDLDPILEIERQAFPKSPYDWATFINLHWLYPETFWVYVDPPDRQETEILGYIIFSKDGHIISIAVHPRHRRRGLGGKLLKKAMETLQGKRVWAEVRKGNEGAQVFYFKMGFRIIGQVPNYYGNEDALIIQWTPSPSGSH
jgi:ribosomal-protein-alanine N-acetyltransferase